MTDQNPPPSLLPVTPTPGSKTLHHLTREVAGALEARIKQATIPDSSVPSFGGTVGHLFAATPYDLAVTAMAVVGPLVVHHAELENALNWQTSCTGCAGYLDASIREYERADKAEAAINRAREVHYPITHAGKKYCVACSSGGLELVPYPCRTIRALAEPVQQGGE